MRISFFGAAHEVTGSCHLVEIGSKKILFDCGMFQGDDFNEGKNADDFPFDPKEIDAVLVSHAHLDHTGRIPKLCREGFVGTIFMTEATCEFAKLIWADALDVMQYNNKKFQSPVFFSENDIAAASRACHGVRYNESVDLGDGVRAIFRDAGHIFGSAFIELSGEGKTLGFSGDLGNEHVPILKDTHPLDAVDVLLCESTYGDRVHEHLGERKKQIFDLMKEGWGRGGTIMIPAFSLERTQEFLYELNTMSEDDHSIPDIPIFLDSPLAIDAMKVYKKYPEYYDTEAAERYMHGDDFLQFPQLRLTYTREESKTINHVRGPKMVIAGAGMMNGGRILHHAHRYLSDPHSMLIIVGYQAQGTLGRKLYEGAEKVSIFGDEISVQCTVRAVGALSAHGDQKKLLSWIGAAKPGPKKVYCVHGEAHAATELAHRIRDRFGIASFVPEYGEVVEV
ncbi:MAG TPA: MBL fold hydrolase [Candidatus Magasanikbacteria bacterium]|nr:MAG: hypothetical protein A3I74_00580 [Candidatus Magasanikbacteria bacterium RIFCSPLOWO2_02_FULL_47_16]OGH80053.1 MAG: hypothetical protein A3C10_02645 [Candidatus Magasanikbacteria bacterium RIFCSPHIGHO2_02_FULL_48_18]HAZ28465.1 MBL fold hydrolase [Candidatus Magasanikbacteria bacterium]